MNSTIESRFDGIKGTAKLTGLSQHFIRAGCKDGSIPHVKVGNRYKIDVPAFLKMLDKMSEREANT